MWQRPGKNPLPGSLCTQTSQNWISRQDRPMPPPPGTSDSEPPELHKAPDGKQGSGIPRKTNVKACSCAARIFRNQEVETGRASLHPTGVLGRWECQDTEHGVTRRRQRDWTQEGKQEKFPGSLPLEGAAPEPGRNAVWVGGNRLPRVRICFWHLDTTSGGREKWEDVGSPG